MVTIEQKKVVGLVKVGLRVSKLFGSSRVTSKSYFVNGSDAFLELGQSNKIVDGVHIALGCVARWTSC